MLSSRPWDCGEHWQLCRLGPSSEIEKMPRAVAPEQLACRSSCVETRETPVAGVVTAVAAVGWAVAIVDAAFAVDAALVADAAACIAAAAVAAAAADTFAGVDDSVPKAWWG